MPGIFIKRRILGSWIFGNTFFLMIFSMMRGTEMITRGFTSAKAAAMMAGEGMRVRKKMWHPLMNSKRNSNDIPYM